MSKKLDRNLASLSLQISTPNQSNVETMAQAEPISNMYLNLVVEEIDFYEKNPRKHHDPEQYIQIKESIRSIGIQQPVHVTLRPGATHYVLAKGGNTRLKILKELYAETGEEQFKQIACIYIPYTNETDLQIAHVVENEQRADMTFWDKANAYAEIRDTFQKDLQAPLSLRELESLFSEHGLSISHQSLSLYFLATNNLQPLASRYGQSLSGPKVREIRKCFSTLEEAFKAQGKSEDFFDFTQLVLTDWVAQQDITTEFNFTSLIDHMNAAYEESYGAKSLINYSTGTVNKTHLDLDMTGSENTTNHPVQERVKSPVKKDQSPAAVETTAPTSANIENTPGAKTDYRVLDARDNPQHKEENAPVNNSANIDSVPLDDALKKLQKLVRSWLNMVNLPMCYKLNNEFKYGFYIEYPPFEDIPHKPGCVFAIDTLHPEAGNVFAFLTKISGQEDWFNNLEEEINNPILHLPECSKYRIAYQNPEKYDEFRDYGIGERNHLLNTVIDWQTTGHPFQLVLDEIFQILRHVNKLTEEKVNE